MSAALVGLALGLGATALAVAASWVLWRALRRDGGGE